MIPPAQFRRFIFGALSRPQSSLFWCWRWWSGTAFGKLRPFYLETARLVKMSGTAAAICAGRVASSPPFLLDLLGGWCSRRAGIPRHHLRAIGFFNPEEKQYLLDRIRRTSLVVSGTAK